MTKRITLLLFAVLCGVMLAPRVVAAQVVTPGTEILWDEWGVPHIYAEDNASAFYAYGYAQMQNHGDLILSLYGNARGEAARYWGEAHLENDRLMHTLGISQIAETHYAAQSTDMQAYLDAFVAGMNAYVADHPTHISEEMARVLPVRSSDPLAHVYNVLVVNFISGRTLGQAQQWQHIGSNALAVGPSRSASGNAMLLTNPHLLWQDMFIWMEAQIVTPDANLYGASLVGVPVLTVGFNQRLGWTHTVNTYDGVDLYELSLTGDGGYLYDGEVREFDTRDVSVMVRQPDGSLVERGFPVMSAVHGPVIMQREDDKVLALRTVSDTAGVLEQWWQMGTANNLEEFKDAMAMLQLPMFTTVYADADGHIYYLYNGQVPVREQGNFFDWVTVQPGDDSDYLWDEIHAFDALPQLTDPESGFVQNANEPPWTASGINSLNPQAYPSYLAPQTNVTPDHILRPMRSLELITETDTLSFDDLHALKHDTHIEMTDRVLDDLLAAAAASDNEQAQQAAAVLADWDRKADADSRGTLLFITWFNTHAEMYGANFSPWALNSPFAVPFDPNAPFSTPSGLADPALAVEALVVAADQVIAMTGALDVPYGEFVRLRAGDYDLPANGGLDPFGVYRSLGFMPDEDGKMRAVVGDTYYSIVEFGETPRAKVLLAYGNATQPGNRHVGDQLPLFSEKQMRDALLTRDAVEDQLDSSIAFE